MKRKSFLVCALLAFCCIFSACGGSSTNTSNATEKKEGFKIKRGTNLSHWLSQSEERGEKRRLHIQEDDFVRLDSLGFDHVRIPIDEEQFWDEQGNKLPEAWGLLKNALNLARKHNILMPQTKAVATRFLPMKKHRKVLLIFGVSCRIL